MLFYHNIGRALPRPNSYLWRKRLNHFYPTKMEIRVISMAQISTNNESGRENSFHGQASVGKIHLGYYFGFIIRQQ